MRIYHGFDSLPAFRRPVVTVGSFDGVHRGHRALIERLVAEARDASGDGVVLTFEPHPRVALGRAEGLRLLTPLPEKAALLEALGVDALVVAPFDDAFAALTGRGFIDRILLKTLGARTLIAGYNHRFGCDGVDAGTAAAAGLRVVRVDECRVEGIHVSSTAIRRLLERGDRAGAERLLGHPLASEPKPPQP